MSSVVCMNHGSIAITSPAFSFSPRPATPSLVMCGSPCMVRPTPWPPNRRLMPRPSARATDPMACEMSPSRLPGRAASMPAARARSVVSISSQVLLARGADDQEYAESATQPSTDAAKSTLSRSPSTSV